MSHLGEKDRDAVILRYFEEKSLSEVGVALGTNEDTARKRVSRSVEKLRKFFTKRGTVLPAATLIGLLSANTVSAAPAGLASTIAAGAILKGTVAASSTLTLIKGTLEIMAWTKLKTAAVVSVGVLLAAGTATVIINKRIEVRQYTVAQEPWSDIGAATPTAALQSLAWALSSDKIDRAQELMDWDEKGPPHKFMDSVSHQKLILTSTLAPILKDIESFQILSIESTTRNESKVKIQKTFKDSRIFPFAVTLKLRRAGNQWRVVGDVECFENGNVSMRLPFSGSFD